MPNVNQQIEKMIDKLESRYPDFSEDKHIDLLTLAILLHAKVIREVGNEIVSTLDEVRNEIRSSHRVY